jgi:hypothetical protein
VVGLAVHVDDFLVLGERTPALRRAVPVRVVRVQLQQDQVAEIALRVGEAPRHVPVAPHDDQGHARKGDAHDPTTAIRFGRLWPVEHGPVPDVRDPDSQVHVVGHDRPAVGRQAPRDRPVVAADDGLVCRRPEDGGHQVGAVCRVESGRRAVDSRGRSRAQVVDVRAGDRRHREGLAQERRIPLRAVRREEVGHRRRQHVVEEAEGRLVAPAVALQRDEHREHDEDRVLDAPRQWLLAEQQVLERRLVEVRQQVSRERRELNAGRP